MRTQPVSQLQSGESERNDRFTNPHDAILQLIYSDGLWIKSYGVQSHIRLVESPRTPVCVLFLDGGEGRLFEDAESALKCAVRFHGCKVSQPSAA